MYLGNFKITLFRADTIFNYHKDFSYEVDYGFIKGDDIEIIEMHHELSPVELLKDNYEVGDYAYYTSRDLLIVEYLGEVGNFDNNERKHLDEYSEEDGEFYYILSDVYKELKPYFDNIFKDETQYNIEVDRLLTIQIEYQKCSYYDDDCECSIYLNSIFEPPQFKKLTSDEMCIKDTGMSFNDLYNTL